MPSLEDLTRTTEELVAIPSISADRDSCHRTLDYVEKKLPRNHGFHLEHFEHQGFRSLIVSTRPGRKAGLILNAHLDVVHAEAHQFQARRENGRLHGRGAYDMKGSAAVFLHLLQELAEQPVEVRPDLQVQFVTDEEIGGHRGVERLVPEGFTADLVIAGEPTDLGIGYRAKGVLWLSATLTGTPGHAARPWLTRNPVLALHRGLNAVLSRYPHPPDPIWETTCTPTYLEAGNSHNRVPDTARIKLDIRYIPEDSPQEIVTFVESAFPGCEVEIVQLGVCHNADPEHPLIQRVADLQEEMTGSRPRFFSEHFASDARYYTHAGVPAICWGPSGQGMHADDEQLDLESLHLYYQMVKRLASTFR